MQQVLDDFAERVRPEHTAVLVVDVQNDFCAADGFAARRFGHDAAAAAALAGAIVALTDAARAAGALVVWIRAIYDPRYLSPPMLAGRDGSMRREVRCAEGSWGADFFMVAPRDGDYVIDKHRYSAFCDTPLDAILRARGIRTAVVTGVTTNVCVDSTLRDGFNRGYYIVVPEDCVAAFDPALHEATLRNVALLFGDVTSAAALAALWHGAAAARD